MGKAKGGTAADTAPNSVALREELENLSCRFIVNLPANELASIERIGFQVEQAYVGAHLTQALVLLGLPLPAECKAP